MTKNIEWRERMALWLGHAADAAEAVTVIFECKLPNGRHMVTEEWPSRDAYQEFTQFRMTLEAMKKATDGADNQGGRWN
jgi:hypothetical protein